MSVKNREHVGGDKYRFLFSCDWPECQQTIERIGHYRPDYTMEDIEYDAIYFELKHGDWGTRNSKGHYCPNHSEFVAKIIKQHWLLVEAQEKEDEADKIVGELRDKGVGYDTIWDVERFEVYDD